MFHTAQTKLRALALVCAALSLTTLSALSNADAQGTVPEYMPYQGFLSDATGTPINTSANLTFKLYEDLLSATPLWEESAPDVNVSYGAFSVNLGSATPNLRTYLYTGQAQYIGISINGGPELSPRSRLGTLPYAFLSYNALRFDGRSVDDFVTQEEFTTFQTTFTGGLSEAQVNALIDARGYLDTDAINALIDARGYLNTDAINALIDARGYLNADAINALIDNRNYLNAAEIDARIAAAVAVVNTRVNTLEGNLTNLTNTVNDLRNRINALENQGQGLPFILGTSNQASDGWFQFTDNNNVQYQGVRAAGEMCKASYPNDANAHFCSMSEVQTALSVGSFNANINNQETWVFPSWSKNDGGFAGDNDFCQSLLYNSADAATGTSVRVLTEAASTRGGLGVRLAYNDNRGCGTELRVLCCR